MTNLWKIKKSGKNRSKLVPVLLNNKRQFTPEEFKEYNERMWNEITAMLEEYSYCKTAESKLEEDKNLKIIVEKFLDDSLDDDFELY